MHSTERRRRDGRLAAWIAFVALLSATNYAFRLTGGESPDDLLYRYDTAVFAALQYAFFFGIVVAIAAGRHRELFALSEPRSWLGSVGGMAGVLLLVYVAAAAMSPFLDPGEEQGLTPDDWDESRANAFLANALVVVVLAPIVEELMFRGVGFGLMRRFGAPVAILGTAAAFAAIHGLIEGFPLLFLFGAGLAWLRERTGSVYPCILLHGAFNGIALLASVWS
jgi:uncharacterized protein